jgi:hypothetical protein
MVTRQDGLATLVAAVAIVWLGGREAAAGRDSILSNASAVPVQTAAEVGDTPSAACSEAEKRYLEAVGLKGTDFRILDKQVRLYEAACKLCPPGRAPGTTYCDDWKRAQKGLEDQQLLVSAAAEVVREKEDSLLAGAEAARAGKWAEAQRAYQAGLDAGNDKPAVQASESARASDKKLRAALLEAVVGQKRALVAEAEALQDEGNVAALESVAGIYRRARALGDSLPLPLKADSQLVQMNAAIDAKLATAERLLIVKGRVRTALYGATAVGVLGLGALLVVRWKRRRRWLHVVEGPEVGRRFKLEKDVITIGAVGEDVDWVIDDPHRRLSRKHCQIARSGRHFWIVDLSRNGTCLNGRMLPKGEPVLLRRNDEISLVDEVVLIFR